MAQCPKCGSNNASYKREVAGTKGTGAGVRVRVTKNVSVGTGGGSSKRQYQTTGFCPDCGYTWSTKGRSPLVTALLWLFIYIPFCPIVLSVWFWKTPRIKIERKKKAIILAVIWAILLVIGILTPSSDSNSASRRSGSSKSSTISVQESEESEEKDAVVTEKSESAEEAEDTSEDVTEDTSKEVVENAVGDEKATEYVKNDLLNQFLNSIPEDMAISDVYSGREYWVRFHIENCFIEIQDLEEEFRIRLEPDDDSYVNQALEISSAFAKILDPDISESDLSLINNAADKEKDIDLESKSLSFYYQPTIELSKGISKGHMQLSSTSYGK